MKGLGLVRTFLLVISLMACGGGVDGYGTKNTGDTLETSTNVAYIDTSAGGAIGGTVIGDEWEGLVLQNNEKGYFPVIRRTRTFIIATSTVVDKPYSVTVLKQPDSSSYTCSVTDGRGVSRMKHIVNVIVSCTKNIIPLSSVQKYLMAPNAGSYDGFGRSVAISGDTVVVGAIDEDSNQSTITNGDTASLDNSAHYSGAAYVFRRTGETWIQEAYLKASNGNRNDAFGFSVAISGDTVVVGAVNEISSQTTITNGPIADLDNSGTVYGAVYIFKRTGVIWVQEAYLKASNGQGVDLFGNSVAILGDTVAVGIMKSFFLLPQTSDNVTSVIRGVAYIFKRTGVTWVQEDSLNPLNIQPDDMVKYGLAVSDDTVIVGSPSTSIDHGTPEAGVVYVFSIPTE